METLRDHFSALGFRSVETFIASGNVIFTAPGKSERTLRKAIEDRLQTRLGYEVKTFIRSESEVGAVARYAPFTPAEVALAHGLNVVFLTEPPAAAATTALMAHRTDVDDFRVNGREVYWLSRVRQSESPFATKVGVERALKMPGTIRGMKTITKLVAKYDW